jgi:hypothetical protein
MDLLNYKKGQYLCPDCGDKFSWAYGFGEESPKIDDSQRIKEKCPKCCGLIFIDPKDFLKEDL